MSEREVKYTPGPWRVDVSGPNMWIREKSAPPRFPIADIGKIHYTEEERDANARLIVSAPEMYDVLIKCMSLFAIGGNAMAAAGAWGKSTETREKGYEEHRSKARAIEHEIMALIYRIDGVEMPKEE